MEVNLSPVEQQQEEKLFTRLPLASVTRSMQELFELQKLEYMHLQAKPSNEHQKLEFFPEHTKRLEFGDCCGDACHNNELSSSVQYILPSPPNCDSHEDHCPPKSRCQDIKTSEFCEKTDESGGNHCWNERFKHIRNRAAERQKNAPRLLTTKPLRLRLSKTNLRRKKTAKAAHSGSPTKVNHVLFTHSTVNSKKGSFVENCISLYCSLISLYHKPSSSSSTGGAKLCLRVAETLREHPGSLRIAIKLYKNECVIEINASICLKFPLLACMPHVYFCQHC